MSTIAEPVLKPFGVIHLVPTGRDNPALPTQPELRAVADDVIAEIKYATSVNAAHQDGVRGRLDKILQDFLATMWGQSLDLARRLVEADAGTATTDDHVADTG